MCKLSHVLMLKIQFLHMEKFKDERVSDLLCLVERILLMDSQPDGGCNILIEKLHYRKMKEKNN